MKLWTAIYNDVIVGEGDFAARQSGWNVFPGWHVSSYARGEYYRWQGNSIFCKPDGAILSRRFSYLKSGDILYEASLIKKKYSNVVPHVCLHNCTRGIWPKRENDNNLSTLTIVCRGNSDFSMDVDWEDLQRPEVVNYATYYGGSLWFAIILLENNKGFNICRYNIFNRNGKISVN